MKRWLQILRPDNLVEPEATAEEDFSREPVLMVGLGNPGPEYRHNRHNVGYMVLDGLAEDLGTGFRRMQSKALVTDARYQGRKIILAKPQTYMNESGRPAGSLVKFYKIPLEDFLVVHDDLDLPLGTLRMRPAGGAGGQRGMRSIIQHMGTNEFPRLRVGVGRPPGRMDPADYLLQDFSRSENDMLATILDRAVEAALTFTHEGIQAAMTRYNRETG